MLMGNGNGRIVKSKLYSLARRIKHAVIAPEAVPEKSVNPDEQDLDLYWDPAMAEKLENWGTKTVWKEIQLLMVNCSGDVLDIACGTGKTMQLVSKFPVRVYGCDISDLLISKALEKGIPSESLKVCDATKMPYADNQFEYSYSIGSLEHFTDEGIQAFVKECYRITRKGSFHMLPVSRSQADEGWMKTNQSFFNNSVEWWVDKFGAAYDKIYVLDSTWEDDISIGKWFVCFKDEA